VQEVQSLNLPEQACFEKQITQGFFPWIKTEEVCWNLLNIYRFLFLAGTELLFFPVAAAFWI